MPTDTVRDRTDAARFALRAAAWSLGFFGLLRLNWTETHILLPFTHAQGAVAVALFGTPALPVQVTLACSGADALALCLGAIVAYPVRWGRRLAGAALGTGLILGLNTLRIGTLGRVAGSPAWFNTLHIYVWPAVLMLAIAGYVFRWMHLADLPPSRLAPQPTRRFVMFTVAFLLVFTAASLLYLESPWVLALAGFVARAAATTLGLAGVSAHAEGNVLWTPRGGFLVTQECIVTPLIPVYLAAVCAYAGTWRRLTLGVVATLPLFTALGIARLLVVAVPAAIVASPIFLVHAFYQLLLGVVVVFLGALWRHGSRVALPRALLGVAVGTLFLSLLGPPFIRAITYPGGVLPGDPQGALAFLPAFQVGLYLALWAAASISGGWGPFLAGLAVLGLTQAAGFLALNAFVSPSELMGHVPHVRGWAVAGPVLVFAVVANVARTRR